MDPFTVAPPSDPSSMRLEDGSRVAVVGGGPSGSFFSYFLSEMASQIGLDVAIDIYEPKNFSGCGPAACNMCGGIVSESLVQMLATEGINLPPNVVQRGIDSYVLHMDVGSVRIDPPGKEKRIGSVHRGGGPRGSTERRWQSFDGYLLGLAAAKGATVIRERVESVAWVGGKPRLITKNGETPEYDLLVVAVGINGLGPKLLEGLYCQRSSGSLVSIIGKGPQLLGDLGVAYGPPKLTKTFICELPIGAENIQRYLGNAMHVFLLNLPRLEFAALIPKGDYVTGVMLGEDIDKELVNAFLNSREVKRCLPPDWEIPADYCRCSPSINIRGAARPLADRVVFLGDCAENRLYKDGIGGAYRVSKAAARTVSLYGISAEDFRQHYLPACRKLATDNLIGKVVFFVTHWIQHLRFTRRGLLRMVAAEQRNGAHAGMSSVLWDTFTGSAPYRDVFRRTLHPSFLIRFLYAIAMAALHRDTARQEA